MELWKHGEKDDDLCEKDILNYIEYGSEGSQRLGYGEVTFPEEGLV